MYYAIYFSFLVGKKNHTDDVEASCMKYDALEKFDPDWIVYV